MFKPGPRTHGSSPRLRGTRNHIPNRNTDTGIIPALAGNTGTPASCTRPCGDHPRACGEHPVRCRYSRRNMGSSPRLRGTPARLGHHLRRPGNSSAMIFRVPSGNHSSQICLATRAESDICTYRGSHCSPASRSVFPHRERACADSGNSSIDEYPARVIPTPYLPRLNIPPLSTVYQANQAIGVGIPHAYRIQRLISAVPSS